MLTKTMDSYICLCYCGNPAIVVAVVKEEDEDDPLALYLGYYVVICYKHLFFSPLKTVFIWYYYLHDFLWEIKIALTILVYNGLDINIVYKQFYYSVVVYYCWICFNGLVKPVLWKKENSSLIGFFSFDRCFKKKKKKNSFEC